MSIIEKREAPLDNNIVSLTTVNSYMVTVNISPLKFVNNKHWKEYSSGKQDEILVKSFNKITEQFVLVDYTYRLESIKQGMRHLHFVCSTTQDTIEDIQLFFHKKFGMPSLDPSVVCKYTITEVDVTHAVDYVTKEDSKEDEEECLFRKHIKK